LSLDYKDHENTANFLKYIKTKPKLISVAAQLIPG